MTADNLAEVIRTLAPEDQESVMQFVLIAFKYPRTRNNRLPVTPTPSLCRSSSGCR